MMSTDRSPLGNQPSQLLTPQENTSLFTVLGPNCQSIATAVVELYLTNGPYHVQWIHQCTGAVCFIKDNTRQLFIIQIFGFPFEEVTWEQVIYSRFIYKRSKEFFHTFEGDSCMVGLNFADCDEADWFGGVVEDRLRRRETRREFKKSEQNGMPPTKALMSKSFDGQPLEHVTKPQKQKSSYLNFKKTKKNSKRGKFKKTDIGIPIDFTHVSHLGWDPSKGFEFDVADPKMKDLISQAGVSESQMRDDDTRNFIYGFIQKYEKENVTTQDTTHSSANSTSVHSGGSRGLPARPPPPPPPRVTASAERASLCPPPPPCPASAPTLMPADSTAPINDGRSMLLESIRSGTTLKKVKPDSEEAPPGEPAEQNDFGSHPMGTIAEALARALAERSRVIHSSDSDSGFVFDDEDDNEDDDWDD